MKTYTVTIEARARGAIGIFTPMNITVRAHDSANAVVHALKELDLHDLEPRFVTEVLEQPV
jgi:hypothetical protein